MTLFGISAATLLAWLLVLAFLGAGIVNAAGSAAVKNDFVRWGYNNRTKLGIDDATRTSNARAGIAGKRLMYRDSLSA